MNCEQVRKRLLAEGCNPSSFAIGHDDMWGRDQLHCLVRRGDEWTVFYTERRDHDPIFRSRLEEEACQFFFDHIMSFQHWHLVGFFKNESAAESLQARLSAIGVETIRNDIPVFDTDPRYRVFVVGKEIFRARDELGEQEIESIDALLRGKNR